MDVKIVAESSGNLTKKLLAKQGLASSPFDLQYSCHQGHINIGPYTLQSLTDPAD